MGHRGLGSGSMTGVERHVFILRPDPPYEVISFFERMGRGPYPHLYLDDPPRVTRLFNTGEGYVPVKMYLRGDRWRPEVRVEIFTDSFQILRKVLPLIKKFLCMDIDYRGFIRACIEYEGIRALLMRRIGERPAGHYSRAEAFMEAVIISGGRYRPDYGGLKRFIEAFGRHVEIDGEDYWGFPSSGDIRHRSIDELRRVLHSRVRAWAVKEICCSEEGGEEDVFGVGRVARDYAYSRLSGIGCTETYASKLLGKADWADEAGVSRDELESFLLHSREYCGLLYYLIMSEHMDNHPPAR